MAHVHIYCHNNVMIMFAGLPDSLSTLFVIFCNYEHERVYGTYQPATKFTCYAMDWYILDGVLAGALHWPWSFLRYL
jgi:hypothetical protein